MNCQILGKFVWLVASFLVLPLCVISRAEAQSSQDPAGQLMLLKNGSVLQGFIERTASHYSIQTRPGNRLHLPFEKVELVADSYSEIYWRRLATLSATDSVEQEALFQWCLRYRLWEEAANQLEIFRAINSDKTILPRLERQLSTAVAERDRQITAAASKLAKEAAVSQDLANQGLTNQASPNQAAPNQAFPVLAEDQFAARGNAPAPADSDGSPEHVQNLAEVIPAGNESFFENYEPVFRPLPSAFDQSDLNSLASSDASNQLKDQIDDDQAKNQVVQVGFDETGAVETGDQGTGDVETGVEEIETKGSAASPRLNLSVRELEQFIKSLPKNSFSQFRSRVEPILIANCSDCHQKGGETDKMPILLRSKRLPLTIRMSQRNLISAIRYIDATNVDASSFLKAALTAHGSQASASLTQDSKEFQTLKEWVARVTKTSNADSDNPAENANANSIENHSSEIPIENPDPGSSEPKKMLEPMLVQNLQASQSVPQSAQLERDENAPRPIPIRRSPNIEMLEPLPPTIGEIPSLAKPAERFVPRDDFDPEIFNRQFGSAGSSSPNR